MRFFSVLNVAAVSVAGFLGCFLGGAMADVKPAPVNIALNGPANMQTSGSYVWAHTFASYLVDHGIPAKEHPIGALGGDGEMFDQISQGVIQVSMSPLGIVAPIDNLIFGLRLPYFFADQHEVDHALDQGGMLARINAVTVPEGIRVLAVAAIGRPAGIFNTRMPVRSVADMAGLKMAAQDQGQVDVVTAWGADGTIVDGAVLPDTIKIQAVDGYLGAPSEVLLMNPVGFFSDVAVSPALGIIIVSEDWYSWLGDAERAIVDAGASAASAANRDWLATQGAALDRLETAGIVVERPAPGIRDAFRAASGPVYANGMLSDEQIAAWKAAKGP